MLPNDQTFIAPKFHAFLSRLVWVIGAALLALGLVVIVGWHIRVPAIIQIHSNLVPMQYNTALGFLLAGGGLLAAIQYRLRWSIPAGGAICLIGLLTLIEYVVGSDLGIDQLFMNHYITVLTPHPGRMAPNTALCFMLAGAAIALFNRGQFNITRLYVVNLLGALTIALGFVALSGYMVGLPTAYGWGNFTQMAAHTSLGFIFLGIGLIALTWQAKDTVFNSSPVILGVIAATITIALWQALYVTNAQAGLFGQQADSLAKEFVLAFGLMMTAALTYATFNMLRAQRAASASKNAHLRLIAEMEVRKLTEGKLQLAASVFSHAREAVTITDAAGTIVEVNNAFTRITGYSRDEVVGRNPRILKSGRQPPEYYAAMWRDLMGKGHWTGEIWNRRKNGEVYAEILTISAVRDGAGKTQHYVALFTDITPMKEHQKQLERIANYDALTGLPNRVLLADRLRQAIAHSQRHGRSLAVAYLDLDGFKAVNDSHGHDTGDSLLIAISERMKTALREGDTLARIGGDEFIAVLVDLESQQDCNPVLERLLQAASDPVTIDDAEFCVSVSIGVTLYPRDGAEADQLIRHADQGMYLAKQAGKNRYCFFDADREAVVKAQRESLENFRRALDQNEFVLHYQPKVNMRTGKVIGAEALIRWQHPEHGLLQPGAFLPVIEDQPISVELGEWVIDTALAQMSEWQSAGLNMPVSVNVGALQLQQADFVTRLSEQLAARPDVQPHYLELEILETSALEDVTQISEVMRACHEIGVSFALDDFGTGYSSLTYLKRLPAKLLKIDRSFVRDMLDDPDDLAIVNSVIGLSTAFSRQVIAEGVESVAHGELLLSLGCELAQGYGIARPMPAAEMPGWVKDWQPDITWTAWRERISNPDDITVVYAEVEHRRWLRTLETFLSGEINTPPPMDESQCRFGLWQETQGHIRYSKHPEFPALIGAHERIHALGRELIDLHSQGHQAEARMREAELHTLRNELIAGLRKLVHGGK